MTGAFPRRPRQLQHLCPLLARQVGRVVDGDDALHLAREDADKSFEEFSISSQIQRAIHKGIAQIFFHHLGRGAPVGIDETALPMPSEYVDECDDNERLSP